MGNQLVSQYDGTMVKVGETFRRVDKGAAVPDGADKDHVQMLLDRGMVAEGEPDAGFVDPGGVRAFDVAADAGIESAAGDGRPAQAANKDAWVEYAVAQGFDRDEAEAATKAELIDRFKD